MKQIIWLVSYPKSGNTWFRLLLTNLLDNASYPASINRIDKVPWAAAREIFDECMGVESSLLTFEEIEKYRPMAYRILSDNQKNPVFFKTHTAYTYVDEIHPLIPETATYGVLYLVRNPLDIAVSLANHMNISIDASIAVMADEAFCLNRSPDLVQMHNKLQETVLSWSSHVKSWITAENIKLHLIRYEDMIKDTVEIFSNAVRFCGLEYEDRQIQKALEFSRFSELQRQEQENGFVEKSAVCKLFFNRGEVGYWKQYLNDEQKNKVIRTHGKVMEKLGYLDGKGNPVF